MSDPAMSNSTWEDVRQTLAQQYRTVRAQSEALVEGMETEDFGLQAMADASPPKWHLAHTTWFFETFVLAGLGVDPVNPIYSMLFNSYYETVGSFWPRAERGHLSRPTVADVFDYRHQIDHRLQGVWESCSESQFAQLLPVVVLGLNHEQQHQELLLTDILYNFSVNPIRPVFRDVPAVPSFTDAPSAQWVALNGGLVQVGADSGPFAFDNERPRHRVWLEPFELQSRLVTNREFRQFIEDGGYRSPALWLSEGWKRVREHNWQAPLYWVLQEDEQWTQFTLSGLRSMDWEAPVAHVSYFEADAYARWAGARLASEEEWEVAAGSALAGEGVFLESALFMPQPAQSTHGLQQMFGDVWEWTQSGYAPYPGYRPQAGALGEYNGKFMSGQYVLRGGSCVTPRNHIRPTYRNFFPPDARWQFSGIRLARDVHA